MIERAKQRVILIQKTVSLISTDGCFKRFALFGVQNVIVLVIQMQNESLALLLFAPYAKENVTFRLEGTHAGPAETVMASILWENLTFRGEAMLCMHRMTVVLAQEGDDWVISLLQVTPVIFM